ncbi:MAG: UDP-N-acetylmuramoyl-L-alanine--D-glutamate ligase [Bacteroidota bacterium]|nr:UDP-N-acetylmuramoyl-L-alanine--D-glutamate ligase [Bacteroidota bacterium]MDP4233972.1 UDP-N-acetylmuramoyl-L-alanine--D-glutamate ligase [Bacteroidota bacterium]MDP4242777.1 UDP-N-acetylmuramoyl-L-alanine--D-glutamate ligase [Bacteroidota bacterium]MDP4288491.1 UDP-N-acetylmuramoyl-L-alanine--D-glutamate ligase [Bacteroidota bacterium]
MLVRGKRFSILGAGKSGLAVARLLKTRRAKVFLSESGNRSKFDAAAYELDEIGVEYEFDENTHRVLEADYVVLSPGVPREAPIVKLAHEKGIKILSEIEIAFDQCEAPVLAITGTNGKTTTTTLVGEIFKRAGWNTLVAGNIGIAFSEVVDQAKGEKAVVVLEVSSFQLDTIDTFRPKVSAILNITPDHLDRYKNYEAYIQSKFRIIENQKGHDVFVYNHDDETVRNVAETVSVRTLGFSLKEELKQGAYLQGDDIMLRIGREREVLMSRAEIGIPGPHNLMNAMAAALMARTMGVEFDAIRETLRTFQGVEHRIEFVRELNGVKYYNDSKATNVDSVYYALGSFKEPIILIAGGKDKGNDYSKIKDLVEQHVKAIVTVGKGAEKIEKFFKGMKPIHSAGMSMEEAVRLAKEAAAPGDIVLLSPACASFDMFENYEHRGRVFKELVNQL